MARRSCPIFVPYIFSETLLNTKKHHADEVPGRGGFRGLTRTAWKAFFGFVMRRSRVRFSLWAPAAAFSRAPRFVRRSELLQAELVAFGVLHHVVPLAALLDEANLGRSDARRLARRRRRPAAAFVVGRARGPPAFTSRCTRFLRSFCSGTR